MCLSTNPAKFDAVPFKGNFETNVGKISEIGFDGIELAIRDPKLIDQEHILMVLEKEGMAVPAIGTGQAWGEEGLSFTDPDERIRVKAIDRVISHIDFAEKSGGIIIIGLLRGITRSDVSRDTAFDQMREAFKVCCAKAAVKNVKIAFEPINRYETSLLNSVREGLDFIDGIGAENLGMLLDTFHMNIEEPSISDSIRLAGDRMFHFHYADSNRLYPGCGHIDFQIIMETLSHIGYDGFVSGEHKADPAASISALRGLEYLKSIEKRLVG